MVDNNEQDKIYLEYLALKQKAEETWAQFEQWRAKLREIDSEISKLDQYKKPYMVRVYKEVYYDGSGRNCFDVEFRRKNADR